MIAGFDVFLSYSRADATAVERVCAKLSEAGLNSFLDRKNLPAGQPWQPFLEKELARAGAVAVFLGPNGMGSWQHREVQIALDRQGREPDFPVIPILLPGFYDEPKSFLGLQTWINLRSDLDDPAQVQSLIAAIHRQPPEATDQIKAAICPYRGLLPFREEDAAFFFGRDKWSKKLAETVQQHKLVAVVGRSGSGKSSLVYAGLFPELRKNPGGATWEVLSIRPGNEPLNRLAEALSPPPDGIPRIQRIKLINQDATELRLGSVKIGQVVQDYLEQQPGTDRLLLFVDQWEELYTLPTQTEIGENQANKQQDPSKFIDLLIEATEESPATVVLTVRADFYDRLLQHPSLPSIIENQQINLGPMTRSQLQSCIEGPAKAIGIGFKENERLIERILDDVGIDEGKLPLLEYALRETWEQSSKNWDNTDGPQLTQAAYDSAGRVTGAIGARAKEIYQSLSDGERQAARRLFVSLVAPGEGQEDTRAAAVIPDEPDMAEMVRRFSGVDARLLVTGRDALSGNPLAEVSHEALIRNWDTLRGWIDTNRDILRTRSRIRSDNGRWLEAGRSNELLLPQGIRLEEGRKLLDDHGDVIIDDIAEYIELSIKYQSLLDEQEREKAEAELHAAEELAEERQKAAARFKQTAILAGVGFVLAMIAAIFGWRQQQVAVDARDTAEHAATELASTNKKLAASNESLQQALENADNERERAESAAKKGAENESRALTAVADIETREGRYINALHLAMAAWPRSQDDNRPMLTATLNILGKAQRNQRQLIPPMRHNGPINSALFSKDETKILTSSGDGTARLFDAQTGEQLIHIRHDAAVRSATFSMDEAKILTYSKDNTVRLFDAFTGEPLIPPMRHEEQLQRAVFSRDETLILTVSSKDYWVGAELRLFDAATGEELIPPIQLNTQMNGAVFIKDETKILISSDDGTVRLFNAITGEALTFPLRHEGLVRSMMFSKDETKILTSSPDGTARLIDAATGEELAPPMRLSTQVDGQTPSKASGVPLPQLPRLFSVWQVSSAVFIEDETKILVSTGSETHATVRIFDATTGEALISTMRLGTQVNNAIAVSKDNTKFLTSSQDGMAKVYDADTGEELITVRHQRAVTSVAFSRDNTKILTGSYDGTARLYDVTIGVPMIPFLRHEAGVNSAVFSKDETKILTSSDDGTARIFDTATGVELIPPLRHDEEVKNASFIKNETKILTSSDDGTVRLFDALTGATVASPMRYEGNLWGTMLSTDETKILISSGWGKRSMIRLFEVASGEELISPLNFKGIVRSAVFSKDSTKILTSSGRLAKNSSSVVRLFDTASGMELLPPMNHEGTVRGTLFNNDGGRFLVWSGVGAVRLFDTATGEELIPPLRHDERVWTAVFNTDETKILTSSNDGTARLWDVSTGEELIAPMRHEGWVTSAMFNKDETRILTSSKDGTAWLFDAATGQALIPPMRHDEWVLSAVFSADESKILTNSGQLPGIGLGTARLFDATTGEALIAPMRHGGAINSALFSKDETKILTSSGDSTARLWDISRLPRGDLFDLACSLYLDKGGLDLSEEVGFGGSNELKISIADPICALPPPKPDWAKMQ